MIAANGFAQGVIDDHSHIITTEFVSALETEGRLLDEGFPLPKYNVENHLKWMDEAGVQTSVLTLAAPQPSSAEVVRQTMQSLARMRDYLSKEPEFVPFREMILYKNAQWLFGQKGED